MSSPTPRVVVLHRDGDRPPGMAAVAERARVRYATGEELAEALPGADVLFVWDFLSDAVPAAWPNAGALRWVHSASAGVDRLVFDELVRSEVVVTNARGVFDQPIAEYVLGLVLCHAKDFPATLRLQGERRWRHRETRRITGARALVVGTGPIGRAIARLLRAAGLRVTGAGRVARSGDPDFGEVLAADELGTALGSADYLVLAAPLTPATRGMIDAAALARMRSDAYLINVGRGALVVQDDLVAALTAGTIGGAALDVFAAEPLPPDSPLWELPNVVVSPHMSGDAVGWREELVRLFADNLDRYIEGRPLRNIVDKRHGYVRTP